MSLYDQHSIVQETEIHNSGWKYQLWYNGCGKYFWRAASTVGYYTKEATQLYELPGQANKAAQRWVRAQKNKKGN